jgi:hypothetical protein
LVLNPWRCVKTFFGSSTRGWIATGFTAGLLTGFVKGLVAAFGAVLAVEALAAAFEAVAFEPAAFAEVFAVLLGIALLLFFEDLPAEVLEAVRPPLREVRARLLVAPRLAADGFFELLLELLETVFLRVF